MAVSFPRRTAGFLSVGLGIVLAVAALAHVVAVVHVAYVVWGGYDVRLGTLLVVGIGSLAFGVLMTAGGMGVLKQRPGASAASFFGAAGMFLVAGVLTPVVDLMWIGLPLFGGFLVVAPFLLRHDQTTSP